MDEGTRDSREERRGGEPRRRKVVVESRTGQNQDLDELNRAVKQGWTVVRLSLRWPSEASGRTSEPGRRRFVAVLEREGPQSLFDFGSEA